MSAEPRNYSAGESAKRGVLLARGLAAIVAGRTTDGADRALDRLAAQAVERERAEAVAAEKARPQAVQQRADAKAARRT